MAIQDLLQVVECPQRPIDRGSDEEWRSLQQHLGLGLPSDWHDFGRYYGTGRFRDNDRLIMNVFNPFASNVLHEIGQYCDFFREAKGIIGPDEVPYGIFPERPGLLPWGDDHSGGRLCWLTIGPPDQWPVIVNPPRDNYYEQFDMPMTSFLAACFRREITCVLWADCFVGPEPVIFEAGKTGNV